MYKANALPLSYMTHGRPRENRTHFTALSGQRFAIKLLARIGQAGIEPASSA